MKYDMLPERAFQKLGRRMTLEGGGGGGGGPTTSTTNTSNLPSYLEPYVTRNVAAAESVAGTPYQAYQGQQIAGFNQNQTNTQANIMGMQTPGQYQPANQATLDTMNNSWNNPGTAQSFMNPYQQNVTDIAKSEAARQSDIQGTNDASKFASSGAFGGSRQGVVDAERERNLGIQQNQIQQQGSNQAYQQGQQQYNTQQQQQLAGANQLSNLGTQQQTGNLALLGAQAGVGGQQQALQQSQDTQGQTNFQNQVDYQKQQANWMAGIIHGTPVTASSNVQNYQAPPNTGAQLAGLGIAGLGAYGASQNQTPTTSDRAAKDHIVNIGMTKHHLNLYEFSYKDDIEKKRYRGVMADEVRVQMPTAVIHDATSGYDMVFYEMLGLEMVEV